MSSSEKGSAISFILASLIPYTEANMLLSFKPDRFFDELSKRSSYKKSTIKSTYYNGVRSGRIAPPPTRYQINFKHNPLLRPAIKKLSGQSCIMVIFDIPETHASARKQFRRVLQQLNFEQVQRSVWISRPDYTRAVESVVESYEIGDYVQIYQSTKLFPHH